MRRLKTGSEAWHVIDRGSRRLEIFRDDEDREVFLKILKLSLVYSRCVLWAYGLMSNHYHLVLYGASIELTRCMRRLKNWYSIYHNRKYGLSGATFEGPYLAFLQKSPAILARTLSYVALNPWRAGLRSVEHSWLWTSVRAFDGAESECPVPVDPLMAYRAIDPDAATGERRFREAFDAEMRRPKRPGGDRLSAGEIQGQQFDWLLETAQSRAFAGTDVRPEHAAAYWASLAGVPVRVIWRRLGLERGDSVRSWIDDLTERMRTDSALQSLISPP